MTTFVFRDGVLVEKLRAPPRQSGRSSNIISDIEPFTTQEGVVITSRRELREYERANGVRQVGTDWTGSERPKWWGEHRARERARGR